MSKVCAICGKKPGFGNHRSHSMVATKRRFDPNLQRVRVMMKGKAQRAYVCTQCLTDGKIQKAVRGQSLGDTAGACHRVETPTQASRQRRRPRIRRCRAAAMAAQ